MVSCKLMAAAHQWQSQQEAEVKCFYLRDVVLSLIKKPQPEQPVIHAFTQHAFIECLLDTSPSARSRGDFKGD